MVPRLREWPVLPCGFILVNKRWWLTIKKQAKFTTLISFFDKKSSLKQISIPFSFIVTARNAVHPG